MSYPFKSDGRLVTVEVRVAGPAAPGGQDFTFAIDTACTRTAMSGIYLERLGYREPPAGARGQARTASGGTRAGLVSVSRLSALGHDFTSLPVLWMPIPPTSQVDGLLGLDVFRGRVLTLDFIRGRVTLAAGPWWRFWASRRPTSS